MPISLRQAGAPVDGNETGVAFLALDGESSLLTICVLYGRTRKPAKRRRLVTPIRSSSGHSIFCRDASKRS